MSTTESHENHEPTPLLGLGSSAGLGRDADRAALVARAVVMRAEIQQIFDDAAHWNRVHVPWKGKPIDPDPDGQLRKIAAGIDAMLSRERAMCVVCHAAPPCQHSHPLGFERPNVRANLDPTAAPHDK